MEASEHLFRHKAGQIVAALTHIFGTHNLELARRRRTGEQPAKVSQLKLIEADGRAGPSATVPALTQRQHRIDTHI